MVDMLKNEGDLRSWTKYREFVKDTFKLVKEEDDLFISKRKVPFDNRFQGYAVLTGKKGELAAKSLGITQFHLGRCRIADKALTALPGIKSEFVRGAELTLKKLQLGYQLTGGDAEQADGGTPVTEQEQKAVDSAKAFLEAEKNKKDTEEGGPPNEPLRLKSDGECLAYYKAYGSNWFALKDALRGRAKPDHPMTPEIMWDLWNYRKRTVDAAIEALRKRYPTLIAKSVGSRDLESDYDLTVSTPGSGDDVKAVADFNKLIKAKMGNPPGIVFDTNLYVKDFMAVNENIGNAAVEDNPLEQPHQQLFGTTDRADQDVAALIKQRRYMEVEDYDEFMGEVTEGLNEEQRAAVVQQYEEAESIFQLSQKVQIERAKELGITSDRLEEWLGRAEVLERVRDALKVKLAKAGSFAKLDEKTKGDFKQLSKRQAEIEFGMKKVLAELEHENEAAFLEMNNELYLQQMAEVRQVQERMRAEEATGNVEKAEALKAQAKKLMGTAIFFANEAYHSEGAVQHIVAGVQGSDEQKEEALAKLDPSTLLQSFNEQLGDFFKDLGHYSDKADGEIFYRSSKYLVRLLGAVDLVESKLRGLKPPVELDLKWGNAKARGDAVNAVLYPLRKAADLDPETRQTAAVAEVQRIFGVRTAAGLKQSIRKLSTELNREVRKHTDLSVGRMESKAYHQSRV